MKVRLLSFCVTVACAAACASGEHLGEEGRGPDSGAPSGGAGSGGAATGGAAGSGTTGGAGAMPATGGSGTGGATGGAAGAAPTPADAGGMDASDSAAPPLDAGADGMADGGCNGVAGLACPLGVSVGAAGATSPSLGGSGGGAFTRACGPDQVLTGFDIRYTSGSSGQIRQLRPECSTVELAAVPGSNAFEVRTSNPVLLDVTGGDTSGTLVSDRCPPNQMVVGIVARVATDEVRRFGFSCGPATVAPSETLDGWVLSVGPASYSSPERGRDAGAVTTSYTCPSGSVATTLGGRSGERIDQVNVSCAPLAVSVICEGADASACFAEVAATPVTHTMRVAENGTASLTCSSGTIQEFTSTYGEGCAGTCPVACGQCTLGSGTCAVTYDNTACGDCNEGCAKPGSLQIVCQ